MQTSTEMNRVEELRHHWESYRSGKKRAFRFDAARKLGVSEAELLAVDCGESVVRLSGDWRKLLLEFHRLGPIMALTRNEHAVHEKKGAYRPVSFQASTGLVLGHDIDLRLFMNQWFMGFAVYSPDSKAYRRSFQFFDAKGASIHKVFVGDDAGEVFDSLVTAYRAKDQWPWQQVAEEEETGVERPDAEIDVRDLRDSWAALKDTHDFFPMLKRLNVRRTQALRLAGAPHAERLENGACKLLLEQAASSDLPIMVFVGNPGCIQIHSGPVVRLANAHGWFNVLDPGFDLHLNEAGVAEVWLTRKPTHDGQVTGVELFDARGGDIAFFFGKRKPGIPEHLPWRELAENLPRHS